MMIAPGFQSTEIRSTSTSSMAGEPRGNRMSESHPAGATTWRPIRGIPMIHVYEKRTDPKIRVFRVSRV